MKKEAKCKEDLKKSVKTKSVKCVNAETKLKRYVRSRGLGFKEKLCLLQNKGRVTP